MYLEKLLEFAFLRNQLDFSSINSVVEVTGSYGLLASVILELYPEINYTLVDLAPVSAFAEYYLSQKFTNEVLSYRSRLTQNMQSKISPRIKILCTHQIEDITENFDLFINTASFQEMSIEQVKMYSKFASNYSNFVYLNNTRKGTLNMLGENEYQKFLEPMILIKRWKNILYPTYRPILFKK